jgi:hypothetical protein
LKTPNEIEEVLSEQSSEMNGNTNQMEGFPVLLGTGSKFK